MRSYNFYKWRIWSILTLSFVMALFHRCAIGAISSDISSSLNLNASQLANLVSVTFYTYALMQIPAGLLLDSFGYKHISYLGILFTGIGSILLGISHTIYIAYFSRFLIGAGTSVIFISVLKSQKIWFTTKQFTKASGLLSFIGNIGGVIATFPLAFLVSKLGWRISMIFMGVLCLILFVIIFIFVKDSPLDYGHAPRGTIIDDKRPKVLVSLKTVLKKPATWRNFLVLFTTVGCSTTLTGLWGVNYLVNVYKVSTIKSSVYISFIIYGLVIGSLCIDFISKLFKDNLMLIPRYSCITLTLIWGYILFIAHGTPPLFILAVLFFIIGFVSTAHIVAFTDINIRSSSENSGLASSIVNSGEFVGSSFISLLIGFLLDLHWDGALLNGIRQYTPYNFRNCFIIFFIISLLGIFTTFIKDSSK